MSVSLPEPETIPAETLPLTHKKIYEKPELLLYGDLRDVTLGPSPGIGESGNPGVLRA